MTTDQLPTEAELSILKILWENGPSTVHEVQEKLTNDSGYTTVLKFLQIMYEKGLVDRKKHGRAHRYWALPNQEETQEKMLENFTDKLFDGSIPLLIQRAVSTDKLDHNELEELRSLLSQLKSQEENTDEDHD